MTFKNFALGIACSAVMACQATPQGSQRPAAPHAAPATDHFTQPAISPAEAKAIAKDAFLFGMPNVYIARQEEILTAVPKPEGTRAPFNQFVHFRNFPDPTNHSIVVMNVDTLYSLGMVDLTNEPIVLSIPPMGDRWWLMQVADNWNDVPAAPGTRTEGNAGGDFALCGPNFKGTLPPGLKMLRIDTSFAGVGGRTYTSGPEDLAAVHRIQDQYRLTPLSQWKGKGTNYTPPPDVPVKVHPDLKTPLGDQVFAMPAQEFFSRLNALLVNNPARPADAVMLTRISRIGVKPGAAFSMSHFDADVRSAIEAGVEEAQKAVLDQEPKMGKIVNGWSINLSTGRYGQDYLNRAAATYFFVGANLPEDAVYPNVTRDADDRPLDAANKYTLTFPKGDLPPAKNFWSLTMYDKDGYLVPNEIKRQSTNDRSKTRMGEDGSLTIYIQADNPGPDKEANWLPTPKSGPFKMYLRLYTPEQKVLDGKWMPPAVRRTGDRAARAPRIRTVCASSEELRRPKSC